MRDTERQRERIRKNESERGKNLRLREVMFKERKREKRLTERVFFVCIIE